MKLVKWMNAKVKKMTWLDVSMIKLAVAGFILMVAKLWPPLLSLNWYWYGIIGLIAMMKPTMLCLKK